MKKRYAIFAGPLGEENEYDSSHDTVELALKRARQLEDNGDFTIVVDIVEGEIDYSTT